MSNSHDATSLLCIQVSAQQLPPEKRIELVKQALAKSKPISTLAEEYGASRKFVYNQLDIARSALESAFTPIPQADESGVLFQLPVTKNWLRQLTLSLILTCHSSYQGVAELFQDCFDTSISKGSISNIVHSVVQGATTINGEQDLSRVHVGAHDEIFQNRQPVLVGCDTESTYCYLLSLEKSRDGTTWGTHLLDLEKAGLQPKFTIADFGNGLRAGQKEAWPDIPCYGDVFHAEQEITHLESFLFNRAVATMKTVESLEKKMVRAKKKNQGTNYSRKLGSARVASEQAIALADDIAILSEWLRNDILSLTGPNAETRKELLDFVVEELRAREHQNKHRIGPVRKRLENHGKDLVAFAHIQDQQLARLAKELEVEPLFVRQIFEIQGIACSDQHRWEAISLLQSLLGHKFYAVENGVKDIISQTVRASSIVENLNSRLRNYFFLRKLLGPEYLELLRFYLNHSQFSRSRRAERIGKSPKELLTGKSHAHWLEMLGFKLFKKEDSQETRNLAA
jgi:hypothetical protein